jgi:uncharacterized protein YgiM (DUF1202 family)
LSGEPALVRQENSLNKDWGDGSPHPDVNSGQFSARWTRTIHFSSGTYRFTATMDDGMRVWVDDNLIIDSWWDSQEHSMSADIYLHSGDHRVKVEYYEAGGQAVAKLSYAAVGSSGAVYNWRGEYFNNMSLSGAPAMVRDDQGIDFNWGGGSPAWGTVSADQFSVRWTRDVWLDNGRYRFTTATDDGVRLWVNGQLLIDRWYDQAAADYSAEIDLPGGAVPVKMEYYEHGGGAAAHLNWQRIGGAPSIPPASVWRGQYYNNAYLGGSPVFTREDAAVDFNWAYGGPGNGVGPDAFSVRWTRNLTLNGRYRFSVTGDDGVRLWVNNQLVIDQWRTQAAQTYTADVTVNGTVPVKLEYYEAGALAEVHLSWTPIGAETPPPATGGPYTAFVNTGSLNVRQGPGVGYGIITALPRSTAVTLTHRDAASGWVRILTPGNTPGWVNGTYLASNLKPFTFLPVWPGTDGQSSAPTATVINASYLNLRRGPGVGHPVITILQGGQLLTLPGYRNGDASWVQVRTADGITGWVNAGYLASSFPFTNLAVAE